MSTNASWQALQWELTKDAAPNPFLFTFYMAEDNNLVHPEHIGIVYASLRASLSRGDIASLHVIEDEELQADIETVLNRQDDNSPYILEFDTEPDGSINLESYIEDVVIDASFADVEIGPGSESVLVAPVYIQCHKLFISSTRLIVEDCPQPFWSKSN